MELTDHERRIRDGTLGEAARLAFEQQIAVGEFFGAERFVPVSNVHMMGDTEVMGEAGVAYLEELVARGGRFVVPVTTNARCVDFERAVLLRQRAELIADERALVIWANSVCGARTNYEAGPAAVAAGLTGVTPAYGYHIDEQRAGSLRFEVRCDLRDYADWGALGGIIGRRTLDYWKVPVVTGLRRSPAPDSLKHFGAALAPYGTCAMYHVVGITPEARDETEAFRGRRPEGSEIIDDAMLAAFYASYPAASAEVDVVVFSGPQLSVLELRRVAELLGGRRIHPGTTLIATTNFANREVAARLGYVEAIERAGGHVLAGTCWYIMEPARMAAAFGWRTVLTNSAKVASIIGGYRLIPVLRRTEACVEAAITGRLPAEHG